MATGGRRSTTYSEIKATWLPTTRTQQLCFCNFELSVSSPIPAPRNA
uniref:Uncharacterized protein n=1 Tax=Picea sitchensis TaxID=3332 RepID=A9NWD0_PICSI|nr:unknown [Picea sitchensis]